jgi:hypothetical protein
LGNGEHRAGGRSGNDKHYIEQHERGNKKTGQFQKKVKVSRCCFFSPPQKMKH